MLNPNHACKTPLSSRIALPIALPIALMLAGIFGLGIATIQPTKVAQIPSAAPLSVPAAVPTSSEHQLMGARATTPAPSPEELVSFCSKNVTERRSFVVFKRGTCVVINEPCENPMEEARKILARCKDAGARFLAEPTIEGEMIVAFKDPVFQRFSKNELEKLKPWLAQSASALLTPDESVAAGDGWSVPGNARVGLLARRRMLEDAANSVPVKVIRAKERALASR